MPMENKYVKLAEPCTAVNAYEDVRYVKLKVANLRTVFKKEQNKIRTSQKFGVSIDFVLRLRHFENFGGDFGLEKVDASV